MRAAAPSGARKVAGMPSVGFRGRRLGTHRRRGAKIAHALGVRVRCERDALAAEQGAAVHLADEEVEALCARDAVPAGTVQRHVARGCRYRRRGRRDAVPVAPAPRRRDAVAAGPAQRRPDRRRIPARMHVRGPRLAEILQAVPRGVPGDVAKVERPVVRREVVVEEHAGGVVFEPVELLFEDPPVGTSPRAGPRRRCARSAPRSSPCASGSSNAASRKRIMSRARSRRWPPGKALKFR